MVDKILFFLSIPLFIPHYILYLIFRTKCLYKDLKQWGTVFKFSPSNEMFLFFNLIIQFKEFRNVFYYRIGGVSRFLSWYAPGMPTCFIKTQKGAIDSGLVIQHGHSSRIEPRKAGKNLQVWHNVTIGKNHSGGESPVIGDNVKIMTGSLVFGNITIGDNVVIGGGTVVYKSIPSNCVVVGNPARIVKRNGKKVNETL